MEPGNAPSSSATWLTYALLTVFAWGVYGPFLHAGQVAMEDKENGRYKAFLFVGLAYFLTAVLAPLGMLLAHKANWEMPAGAVLWSLFAGLVGAGGAFALLLALGAGGKPIVVMSVVFAGAPIVSAVYSLLAHPPEGGWRAMHPMFFAGILLAAAGGCMVSYYKDPLPPSAPALVSSEKH